MVPDDIVKPPHVAIAIAGLTPPVRPAELSDENYDLIKQCAATAPNYDAVEIYECLTAGQCSEKGLHRRAPVSLPMVLFVLADQANAGARYRPVRGW